MSSAGILVVLTEQIGRSADVMRSLMDFVSVWGKRQREKSDMPSEIAYSA